MNADTINDDVTMAGEGARALLMNRYRIVRQLGQGGMGSVWLAEDVQLDGKLFAIKMLPSILVTNKRAYQQLKAEALVSMKLVHPNIVALRAFEENDGNPFLVMDYIDGQTLDEYLAERMVSAHRHEDKPIQGIMTESEVVSLLKPVAEALDYAHSKGVVHRDIKPGNVMIDKDGHPFILDFGIAREIQETMTRVTGKMSSGTLLYMSPEQLNGDAPKAPQDVYSFAAMVYECLTGHPPFYRGAIEDQIKNKEPDPPDALSIAASVMAGLAKRPEDRSKCCAAVLAGGEGFNAEKRRCGGAEGSDGKFDRVEKGGAGRGNAAEDRPEKPDGFGRGLVGLLMLAVLGGVVWFTTRTADDAPAFPPVRPPVVTNVESRDFVDENKRKGVQLWGGGPYWAETNIGAKKPEDYGYYFWWGDTVGYKRVNDKWVASDGSGSIQFCPHTPTSGKNVSVLQSEGWITEDGVLAPKHDAAQAHWGGNWRMPTRQEFEDLRDKCAWKWTELNGVYGYRICGKGDYASASIFLPAVGDGDRTSLYNAGSLGIYWSSVPYSDNEYIAWGLYFSSGCRNVSRWYRYFGQPVRAVQGFTK